VLEGCARPVLLFLKRRRLMKRTLAFVSFLALLCVTAPITLAAEGRTPIWLPGTAITADGRYIVTRNITSAAGFPVIDIQSPARRVELDLNGFTLDGGGSTAVMISTQFAEEIVIRNGLIVNAPRGVERPAGLPVASTVVIEDMQIRDAWNTAIYLHDVENPVVRRVNIVNADIAAAGNGIEIDGPTVFKNGTIEHNTVRAAFHAIRVYRGSAFAIRHNRIETPFGHGITVDRCVGCLIEKNTISDADNDGIILWEASNGCKIYNNIVHRGEVHGIHIGEDCFDNLVLDNVIRESGWGGAPAPGLGGGDGLYVEGHRNHIERNTVNYNDRCGILLQGSDNTFGRNLARGNDPAVIGWCAPLCAFGLFPPDSCDAGPGNSSFGDNLIPGPPIF
jgi:parallel beta-helix repeat protein